MPSVFGRKPRPAQVRSSAARRSSGVGGLAGGQWADKRYGEMRREDARHTPFMSPRQTREDFIPEQAFYTG